jgi:NADPH:quinone reductase-like Zn-dependent oxidoreductase
MTAVCFGRYGPPDVLELRTLDTPSPQDGEVLIRVHAATVTPGDCEIRGFNLAWWVWVPLRMYMGIIRPRRPVLGMEFSGVVAAVGPNVTRFRVGDAVLGGTGPRFGTYAEYRCHPARSLAFKPDGVSHAEAATVGACGSNALHYVRQGRIKPGDKVLINGAAGCFGTYAVQLAKHLGAEVTGVDRGDKLDVICRLGADRVVDYTRDDFAAEGERYDVILEIAGKASYTRCLRALRRGGRLVLANPRFGQMIRAPLTSLVTGKRVSFAFSDDRAEDLEYLAGHVAQGALKVVIDRRYPLEGVAEAHRYVESGAKVGQVVIELSPEPGRSRGGAAEPGAAADGGAR